MRSMWIVCASLAVASASGCDEKPSIDNTPDVCPQLVEAVKQQCGEDSDAYKKHKQLYLDAAPTGEPQSDADAQMRVRRRLSCQKGLAAAKEKLDYSQKPDFSVNSNDAELEGHAEQAEKNWEARKAAYEKMSPEERAADEAKQREQRCNLWILG